MHDARFTELLLLVASAQKGGYKNHWHLMLHGHRHQLQLVASIKVRHHDIEQYEVWLMFAHSIVEAQTLCRHICFIAFVGQSLCEQISNRWIIVHYQYFFRHKAGFPSSDEEQHDLL